MERIAITGCGIKVPGANNILEFKSILENRLCTLEMLEERGPNRSNLVAGLVHEDFTGLFGHHHRRVPRVSQLAIASTLDAIEMAGLTDLEFRKTGVILGTSAGCVQELEKSAYYSTSCDYSKFPLLTAGLSNTHSLSSAVSSYFHVNGPSITLSTGCTAATDALMIGKLLLQTGQLDVCIAGGVDAPINNICIYSFGKLNSLALDVSIEKAGVPFSLDYEGFVMSEGAAILVLERETDAIARNAKIYGVLEEVSANNDTVGIHKSDNTGQSMLRALDNAVRGRILTYVNSQALGLRINDINDSIAHQTLFGESVPITSIKGNIGHTMGAAGTVQVISAILSMEYGFIPPTIRSLGKGFEELPIVFEIKYCSVESVAITSHGFGGNNGCIYVSKYVS
jgi:3-oxoacyl-(acyl-carrier-protein) synthase